MAKVRFTKNLFRFFPQLEECELEAKDVCSVLEELEKRHPGLCHYLIDDTGALRKHVNIFVDQKMIRDRNSLSDVVDAKSDVFIAQALSGG